MNEISDLLRKAHEAVTESGVPEEYRLVAFREAIRFLAPQSTVAPRAAATGAPRPVSASETAREGEADFGVSEAQMYDRVVSQTDADRDKLELLVHLDEDGPRIDIAGIKLGKTNAERTRAVAKILTIVRGFGLDEDATDLDVVRRECARLKVYDQGNFSSHVSKLDGFVVSGTGANRKIRARGPGIQSFAGLVDELITD
ncbi:hypothetical protein QE370_003477 [Aeromicrobium sp. SORGH_AS981]|uniref:hypothetical protein n=1 Tax=Aeromicrobium sp. SORGH_AS_0981 TaxID=3041802 RepID=UPI002858A8D0|nr:hypothetical protein [Aeromicrobium sp. SORGH_AS_0981]MDR6120293.1 hypothetical protein [Aeromicrobium sp. SORGH_AS_0981]